MTEQKPPQPPAPDDEPITPKRMGFDPTRPFRYAYHFVAGTVSGTLNNMALWARRGAWVGTLTALTVFFVPALAPAAWAGLNVGALLCVGFASGVVGGALLGTAIGAATGGISNVMHYVNRDHTADMMAKKMDPKLPARAPQPRLTTREAIIKRRQQAVMEIAQLRQLETEMQGGHVERETSRRSYGSAGHHL